MATIFGDISGYTFLGLTTVSFGSTVPAGQLYLVLNAFTTSASVGSRVDLTTSYTAIGPATISNPALGQGSTLALIFAPVPSINAL